MWVAKERYTTENRRQDCRWETGYQNLHFTVPTTSYLYCSKLRRVVAEHPNNVGAHNMCRDSAWRRLFGLCSVSTKTASLAQVSKPTCDKIMDHLSRQPGLTAPAVGFDHSSITVGRSSSSFCGNEHSESWRIAFLRMHAQSPSPLEPR
jgi:hypothetical protein